MPTQNYSTQLNGSGWALAVLATMLVTGRCYCRGIVLHRFAWDDAFMVAALAFGIVTVALVSTATTYGFGTHIDTITDPNQLANAITYTLIPAALSIVASTLGKISVVLFLFRLLGHSVRRRHQWFLYTVTAIMVALNTFAVVIILANCVPWEKNWNHDKPGHCLPGTFLSIGGRMQAVYNALMDIITAGFPAYMVQSLKMKNSTKWGLTFLMGGGIFAAAATIMKVWYMRNVAEIADITYAWGPIAIWYMVEVLVLIIAGTIPTLKPILNKARGLVTLRTSSYILNSDRKDKADGSENHFPSDPGSSRGRRPGRMSRLGVRGGVGGGSKVPGDHTIALNDIDNMEGTTVTVTGDTEENFEAKKTRTESFESILPREQRITETMKSSNERRRRNSSRSSPHSVINETISSEAAVAGTKTHNQPNG